MYVYKPSGAVIERFGEIRQHLNQCDPTLNASIAALIEYSIHRTIQEFRQNPAQILSEYQNYQHEKKPNRQV